jgi:hypothetical protein
MPDLVVHILMCGRALCGLPGVPRDWPSHHRWTGIDDIDHVTCTDCIAARATQEGVAAHG